MCKAFGFLGLHACLLCETLACLLEQALLLLSIVLEILRSPGRHDGFLDDPQVWLLLRCLEWQAGLGDQAWIYDEPYGVFVSRGESLQTQAFTIHCGLAPWRCWEQWWEYQLWHFASGLWRIGREGPG